MTPDPTVYFDSPPDSGYSVDNIAPCVPAGLSGAYESTSVVLDWADAPEADVRFYRVYRGLLERILSLRFIVSAAAVAAILLGVLSFLFFVMAIYGIFQFLGTSEIREMLKWALLILLSFQAIGMLKIWSWMQMDKNVLIQEMKKQEFQISILSEKLLEGK